MGTRGLTMVVDGGEYKIAQYGQWDHYPGGQGLDVLEFANKLLIGDNMLVFKKQLKRVRWITQDEIDVAYKNIGADGSGCVNMDQVESLNKLLPFLNRDHGAKILNMIFNANENKDIALQDQHEFAGDSLLCEWAYLINLDSNELEVFKGFNEDFSKESPRFAGLRNDKCYAAVTSVKVWKINNLPNKKEFLDAFKEDE